jgi:hypothetical protein
MCFYWADAALMVELNGTTIRVIGYTGSFGMSLLDACQPNSSLAPKSLAP